MRRRRKYQTGGVFPDSDPINVGRGQVQMPEVRMPVVEPVDMTRILIAQAQIQARRDAEKMRQEQRDEAIRAKLAMTNQKIHDKLFGDLDSPAQEEILQQIRKDHNIPDEIPADYLDNPWTQKDLNKSLQNAVTDRRYQNLFGAKKEADRVLKVAEAALRNDPEALNRWLDEKYLPYFNNTDPNKYTSPRIDLDYSPYMKAKNVDFTTGFLNDSRIGALKTPEALFAYGASALFAKDKDAAVRQGLLVDSNVPELTPEGQAYFSSLNQKAQLYREQDLDDKLMMLEERLRNSQELKQTPSYSNLNPSSGKTNQVTNSGGPLSNETLAYLRGKGFTDEMLANEAVIAPIMAITDTKGHLTGSVDAIEDGIEVAKDLWKNIRPLDPSEFVGPLPVTRGTTGNTVNPAVPSADGFFNQ